MVSKSTKKVSGKKELQKCISKQEMSKKHTKKFDINRTKTCSNLSALPDEVVCQRGSLFLDTAVKPWDMRGEHFMKFSGEIGRSKKEQRKQEERENLFVTYHEKKEGIKNKMDQMLSLSTNPFDNPFCMAQSVMGCYSYAEGSPHPIICARCYSIRQLGMHGVGVQAPYTHNGKILSSHILCENELPKMLPGESIRINANGELLNHIHFANILNLAEYNPASEVVLFTKRYKIVDDVFTCREKPKNLSILFSNPYVDLPITFYEHRPDFDERLHLIPPDESFWWIDGIFNVVDKTERSEYAHLLRQGDQKPVMCALDCISCYKCYQRDKRFVVIEELKT